MSTTETAREFSAMLNEFLPNSLLKEEFVQRDYLYSKVEKDETWLGGTLIVPFQAAGATSVLFGNLTDSSDIASAQYVRGEVSGHKELWGSMIFNQRDLMEHGRVSEQNFLKMLPDQINDFMDFMKNVVSVNLLNGGHFAKATADGDASGNLTVDRPDRFQIGQKCSIDDDNSAAVTGYVRTINMNTRVVTFYDARTGGSAVNLSGYTLAQNAKVYHPGSQSLGFSSLRDALLSAANGGGSTLYGQTKTAYPYLQAINVDGSSITANNIMEKIFEAFVKMRQFGKGNPTTVVLSYSRLGDCMKVIEASKGAYNVTPGSMKASQYGWTEIEVGSVTKGGLKLVGVQEADDDVIMFIDWRALKFYSNGGFRKNVTPDGNEYFVVRNANGYQYIVDVCLFGELVVHRPSYCGIIHSVTYAAIATS
jgi:hypothetical protein